MSVSTPSEPPSYDPPRRAERTSILGRADDSAGAMPPESAATEALPAGWADEQPAATSVMPAGSAGWADDQPATSVMPTRSDEWADGRPTTAVPAYAPEPTVRAPAAPAQWNAPMPQPAAQPQPEPQPAAQPQPATLPPNRSLRRRTAATPIGTVLLIASVLLLGWGVYTLLTSIRVFDIILSGAGLINGTAATAAGVGALLALFAFIAALIACARARPKTAAIMLLLGSLFLPLASTVGAAYYGGTQLKDQTLADAQGMAGKVNVSQVQDLINQVKGTGIDVSWGDELLRILGGGGSDDSSGNGANGGNRGGGNGGDSGNSDRGGSGYDGDSGNSDRGGSGYDGNSSGDGSGGSGYGDDGGSGDGDS